jgi:hypothetical protein
VSHSALFAILRKRGCPEHFVNILIRLHRNANMHIDVNGETARVDINIGIKQGSNEGPSLFLYMILAFMDSLEFPSHIKAPMFHTCVDGKVSMLTWNEMKTKKLRWVCPFLLMMLCYV